MADVIFLDRLHHGIGRDDREGQDRPDHAVQQTAREERQEDSERRQSQALTEKAMKMGQVIYEKEQAAAASPGAEAPAGDGEEVVDAEFSEVDENKG